MKIFLNKKEVLKFVNKENNLGFVPTMGNIHKGHISLFKRSLKECNKTLVSIFVNKPQFNKKKDYKNYPRTINKDIALLKKIKVDYLYMPSHKQIYPDRPNKKIKISSIQKILCGKFRPGHFQAVVDVIDRFIKITKPKKIYFGEKDMQQLKIVSHYVKKKFYNVKVVSCKTVREKNGIAYSSRNRHLSKKQKKIASKIYKILIKKKKKIINKRINLKLIKRKILDFGVDHLDYLEFHNINKLITPYKRKNVFRIFIAYYIGSTRLIDNI